eukprot:67287-Pelagomonas_calceolata.AAC.3
MRMPVGAGEGGVPPSPQPPVPSLPLGPPFMIDDGEGRGWTRVSSGVSGLVKGIEREHPRVDFLRGLEFYEPAFKVRQQF